MRMIQVGIPPPSVQITMAVKMTGLTSIHWAIVSTMDADLIPSEGLRLGGVRRLSAAPSK